MIHIVHAAYSLTYYVDAEDGAQAIRILDFVGMETRNAVAEPYENEVPAGTRIYTTEDAQYPLLNGKYILKLRQEDGLVNVAEVTLGPFWTEVCRLAEKMYGEENVAYEWVPNK